MTRVKRGTVTKQRHKRLLKETKGNWGQRKNVFRRAAETLMRAKAYAYKGRKLKKRDMRALFITRISAAAEQCGVSYSVLMHKLSTAQVQLNRKMLSQIAVLDQPAFAHIVSLVNK